MEDKELYYQIFSLIVRSGIVRFVDYIKKEGKRGMIVAQNAAKWIDNPKVKNFRGPDKLRENFWRNRESLGEAWYQRWRILQDEDEYLRIIRKVINYPDSKKVMWADPSLIGVRPRLGYLYRKGGLKPILVVIDQEGFIERAETLQSIWQDLLSTMDGFFKIDVFSDELLYPVC